MVILRFFNPLLSFLLTVPVLAQEQGQLLGPEVLDDLPSLCCTRIQDSPHPAAKRLVSARKVAVEFLIGRLTSERLIERPVLPYLPVAVEGDLALFLLNDLFLDKQLRSSFPDLCWNNILLEGKPLNPDDAYWDLIRRYVEKNGRRPLYESWSEMWERNKADVVWDSRGRFFRHKTIEPVRCYPPG